MIFIIHAVPKPKGRPRVTRSGHAFTPKATREYEKLIISEWEVQHSQVTPIENPIAVRVIFHMPIPAVLDALNGKAYHDDNQIVEISAEKRYSSNPRTEVFISELVKGER